MSVLVGWGVVGPPVNKFKQISIDDHHMSLAGGGRSPGLMCREVEGVKEREGEGGRSPGLMSRPGDSLPCDLSHYT